MRRRTRARERALQALYQIDLRGEEVLAEVDAFLVSLAGDEEARSFARTLIAGCRANQARLDETITGVAEHWDLHRMAVIDRCILRMACFELLDLPEIPPKVSINEAIDLAKRYSTAESGSFVNGLLDKVRIKFCPEKQ